MTTQTLPLSPPTRGSRRFLRVAIGATLSVLLLSLAAWRVTRPAYGSAFLDATWVPYREPYGHPVVGRITNWNGVPAVGQRVTITDDAGTWEGTADADGRFGTHIGDTLRNVTVVGIDSIPVHAWDLPPGDVGVSFDIHLKRPAPPSRGPL